MLFGQFAKLGKYDARSRAVPIPDSFNISSISETENYQICSSDSE